VVLFHVTDRANRSSIEKHGLDWRHMGPAPGIAGSLTPEREGVFLCLDRSEVDSFVEMAVRRGAHDLDIWQVSLDVDLDVDFEADRDSPWVLPADGSFSEDNGYLYYRRSIPPERLRLLEPDQPGR
jgi:hypothetical protein